MAAETSTMRSCHRRRLVCARTGSQILPFAQFIEHQPRLVTVRGFTVAQFWVRVITPYDFPENIHIQICQILHIETTAEPTFPVEQFRTADRVFGVGIEMQA